MPFGGKCEVQHRAAKLFYERKREVFDWSNEETGVREARENGFIESKGEKECHPHLWQKHRGKTEGRLKNHKMLSVPACYMEIREATELKIRVRGLGTRLEQYSQSILVSLALC